MYDVRFSASSCHSPVTGVFARSSPCHCLGARCAAPPRSNTAHTAVTARHESHDRPCKGCDEARLLLSRLSTRLSLSILTRMSWLWLTPPSRRHYETSRLTLPRAIRAQSWSIDLCSKESNVCASVASICHLADTRKHAKLSRTLYSTQGTSWKFDAGFNVLGNRRASNPINPGTHNFSSFTRRSRCLASHWALGGIVHLAFYICTLRHAAAHVGVAMLFASQADVFRCVPPPSENLEYAREVIRLTQLHGLTSVEAAAQAESRCQNAPDDYEDMLGLWNGDWTSRDRPQHYCAKSATDRRACCPNEEASKAAMKAVIRAKFTSIWYGVSGFAGGTKKWCESARTAAQMATLANCHGTVARGIFGQNLKFFL